MPGCFREHVAPDLVEMGEFLFRVQDFAMTSEMLLNAVVVEGYSTMPTVIQFVTARLEKFRFQDPTIHAYLFSYKVVSSSKTSLFQY